MKPSNGASVYAAVAYADVFGYPLTLEELHHWSIGKPSRRTSTRSVTGLATIASRGQSYVTLKGRAHLVAAREDKMRWAKKKWVIARRTAGLLSLLPTVRLVGITGGLAMNNVIAKDDVDVLIIAERGTLWTTRLITTLILDIARMRRRPRDRRFTDKACLNMHMDESALALPISDRDLFAAHEVLQMKPVWERNGTYRKFLHANQWVKKFLPNAWREQEKVLRISYYGKNKQETSSLLRTVCTLILRIFESLARRAQLRYMRRRRTTEVVNGGIIRFHPSDARIRVRNQLDRRLRKNNIPLDKFFYGQ
jgi:hypothetical protein